MQSRYCKFNKCFGMLFLAFQVYTDIFMLKIIVEKVKVKSKSIGNMRGL